VSRLKTYIVTLCLPALYPVKAENEEEAKRKATEQYMEAHDLDPWIEPEVLDVRLQESPIV
jgi:hypothetical protein